MARSFVLLNLFFVLINSSPDLLGVGGGFDNTSEPNQGSYSCRPLLLKIAKAPVKVLAWPFRTASRAALTGLLGYALFDPLQTLIKHEPPPIMRAYFCLTGAFQACANNEVQIQSIERFRKTTEEPEHSLTVEKLESSK